MKWTKGLAILWIAVTASGMAKAEWEEAEEIPAEKVEKTQTLTVSMHGNWKGYLGDGASSATVIEGYKSYEDCSKAGGKLALTLMETAQVVGSEKWDSESLSTKWSCRPAESYKE